jgi:hypothetical protein
VLLEHHYDSLQLIDTPNSIFLHPSDVPRSAGELQSRRPFGLAVDPLVQGLFTPTKGTSSTTPTVEAPRLLPRHPPASQPAERRVANATGENSSRPTVDSIPALSRSLCVPCSSLFTGPSPGTLPRRHGRRHPSSPAMLRHLSWCTSPTREHSRSCRSCRTSFSPAKPSSPARTRRSEATAVVFCNARVFTLFKLQHKSLARKILSSSSDRS